MDTPIEFINITPINPLISKCQIKVCYVGEEPNRNGSIITKEVARGMANSLPGSPIVGFFNEDKQDFEEHNRVIDISNGEFKIKDTTRPYGFVDLNAKVWFQKFLDDGQNEHEYMMTEGWLWTGQYPECKRIIDKGNNQSMELDEETLDATWSKNKNNEPLFFIINEAIISKLCILGESNEPCFEGSTIKAPTIQFALEEGFKEQLFSMINELKDLLNKGGEKVFTRYSVEIGDTLWNALYDHVKDQYSIESVCEDGEQKFAVLIADNKYYRLNFTMLDDAIEFAESVNLIEDYTPEAEPQFDASAVEQYAQNRQQELEKNQNNEGKVDKYNLEEIQEYVELNNRYSELTNNYNALNENYTTLSNDYSIAKERITNLETQIQELTSFKKGIEKAEKQKMIDSFYMLSDEDKKDVVENIDTYSLDDIEAKLSIICVRNKVSFNLDDNNKNKGTDVTLNLNGAGDDNTPAWVKAIRAVAQEM